MDSSIEMEMEEYKRLEVYQLAHQLAVEIHAVSLRLPKYELYEQGSQIRRSSKAVAVNIVEGFGRRHYQQEYVRFLVFAHASCEETIEHLDLLFDTKSISDKEEFDHLRSDLDTLARKLNKLIQAIRG
ncbi:MAG TPA: four helix bundle protein [Verrucomicrobiae bacterium]|nr:four helix bundle protein [Verrucomicrobiae bacterium]